MARPSASASAEGQCGLKPKFEGIVSRRSSRATQVLPGEEARAFGELGELHEACGQAVALAHARRERSTARALLGELAQRPLGIEGVVGREWLEVALVDQLARQPAQRRALAPAVALERDAAVEGVQ